MGGRREGGGIGYVDKEMHTPSSDPKTPPAPSPCPHSCAGSTTACR